MKIIVKTAPEAIYPEDYSTSNTVFLAGGITNCVEWQDLVIEYLMKTEADLNRDILILNPRRPNFPMGDQAEAGRQIEWEFDALNASNVFSVWFSNSSSVQPITLYELGRQMVIRAKYPNSVIVGVGPAYSRLYDVYKQVVLADASIHARISTNLCDHSASILRALAEVDSKQGGDFYGNC